MKQLLFISLLFIACGNPKADIVERQKQIKVEMKQAEMDKQTFWDSVQKVNPNPTIEQEGLYNRLSIQKEWALQKEYDSLEFELKKY